MKITGTIKDLWSAQRISEKFVKREVVITTDEQYPQTILVEFHQDKTELLDAFSIGEKVEVSINLRGREWTNPQGEIKYFNTIQGWRITKADQPQQPAPAQQATQPEVDPMLNFNGSSDEDDLPF